MQISPTYHMEPHDRSTSNTSCAAIPNKEALSKNTSWLGKQQRDVLAGREVEYYI